MLSFINAMFTDSFELILLFACLIVIKHFSNFFFIFFILFFSYWLILFFS